MNRWLVGYFHAPPLASHPMISQLALFILRASQSLLGCQLLQASGAGDSCYALPKPLVMINFVLSRLTLERENRVLDLVVAHHDMAGYDSCVSIHSNLFLDHNTHFSHAHMPQ